MEREKEALREWAKENGQSGFASQAQQSYWLKRDNQTYLQEWNFESVPEINLLLDQLEISKNNSKAFEEIKKTVLVSIMKGKQEKRETGCDGKSEDLSLPEYIYVF